MDENFLVESFDSDRLEVRKLSYLRLAEYFELRRSTVEEVVNACLDVLHATCVSRDLSLMDVKRVYEIALEEYWSLLKSRADSQ